MIVNLKQEQIIIEPMVVPEPVQKVFIEYVFEQNTDHLVPYMYFNDVVYIGNHIFIDTSDSPHLSKIRVELLDNHKNVVRTYTGEFAYNKYCIIGRKPITPNLDTYINHLKQTIISLKQKITELENRGEVI